MKMNKNEKFVTIPLTHYHVSQSILKALYGGGMEQGMEYHKGKATPVSPSHYSPPFSQTLTYFLVTVR
jgi:hypothetical protein